MEKSLRKKRNIIKVFVICFIIAIIAIIGYIFKVNKKQIDSTSGLSRVLSYAQVEDEDENIEGTDNVKFDAFFLRDLDGDGIAEGVRGTYRELSKEDNLYFEIKVLKEGYFENGKITINTSNCYLYAALVKDAGIKENYISSNIKEIELNKLTNGTQKLLITSVRSGDYAFPSEITSAIGNNINNYSGKNTVTLTGTYVSEDGTRTEITKTVEFDVDWFGKLNCEIPEVIKKDVVNLTQERKFAEIFDTTNQKVVLDFNFGVQETKNEALLKKSYIEGTIPEFNGFKPSKVEISGVNVTFTYDENTRKFTAQREAIVDENGNISTHAFTEIYENIRINEYGFHIEYPAEAYTTLEDNLVNLAIPINAYIEAYNAEFENPLKSNVATNTIHISLQRNGGDGKYVSIRTGERITDPVKRYVIKKAKPLKIYDGISESESNDIYKVRWVLGTGSVATTEGTILKETPDGGERVSDNFITADNNYISMENIVKNVGIYLEDPTVALGDNGWLKIYDDETDELIETFTKDNWSKYTENNYYKYKTPIKHIRIETSNLNANSYLNIYNVKEIDDEYIVNNFSKEEFDNFKRIVSYVTAYIGNELLDSKEYLAVYEAPISIAEITINNKEFTTQEIERNTIITISTKTEQSANQIKWINGNFLVKFPEEVLNLEINNVNINNSNVEIVSYEVFDEDGVKCIRIITSNDKEASFNIDIDCDILFDPRVMTVSRSVELYATNENDTDYYYTAQDIYDVNQNGNRTDIVNYNTTDISIIAPSTLLTNQIGMEYSLFDKIAIAPEIAYITKEQRTAKVNIELNNNYKNSVSEVLILGKIPFKGNTYVITNDDLGSTFSCNMKSPGIIIPEELKDIAKVYYSENEMPNRDLTDVNNGWTETPSDFSKIKTFMIDLGDTSIASNMSYNFSYEIEVPEGLNYNDISYCHYGLYFSLDTDEGKYRTQAEPNKLGFMIAKEYDLDIIKYQKGKDKPVSNAIYRITEDGQEESKTRVTDENGKLTVTGLLLGYKYKIKEIKSPEQYELNEDEIVFSTHEENSDIALDFISGNVKSANVIKEEGKDSKVQIEVEDEVRVDLEILKVDSDTNIALQNIRYRITGEGLAETGKILNTNSSGIISLSGLYMNKEYTIEEVRADGYFINDPVKVILVNESGQYNVQVTGNVKSSSTTVIDEIPKINLEIENKKIPRYNIEITKVKKGTDEPLSGAKFRLLKDEKIIGEYVTDETGKINISNLYVNNTEKNINNVYTLKEVVTPVGFAKIKDITFKVEEEEEGNLSFIQESENTINATIEGDNLKLKLEDSPAFKLVKKDGETGNILPGTKFAIYNIDNYTDEVAKDSKGNIVGNLEVINGNEYYVLTTNEFGEITANLPEGIYKAVEVETLESYELSKNIEDRTYYFAVGESREGKTEYRAISGYNIGESENNEIVDIAETSDSGTVAIGNFEGNLTLKDGSVVTNIGKMDAFVAKYDVKNNLQWFYNIGGVSDDEFLNVTTTSDNSIVVTGYFQDAITLSNGVTLTSKGSRAAIIIKYSEEGDILWYDVIDGTSSEKMYKTIERTNEAGEIEYVVLGNLRSKSIELSNGEVTGRKIYSDIYIAIYSTEGILKTLKTVAGSDDTVNNLTIDLTSDGGYIVSTDFIGNFAVFSNDIETASYNTTIQSNITIKLNSNFEVIWINPIISLEGETETTGVVNTEDGGYIITFNVEGTITLPNGEELLGESGIHYAYIIKYNKAGEIEWKEIYKGSKFAGIYSIEKTLDNNYLLSIRLAGNINISGETFSESGYRGYIAKYDQNGNRTLLKEMPGEGSTNLYSAIETKGGTIIVSGYFREYIGFYSGDFLNNSDTNYTSGMVVKFENVNLPVIEETYSDIYSSEGNDEIMSIVATKDGGYATVGSFSNTVTLSNGQTFISDGYTDCIFTKYNAIGIVEHSFIIKGKEIDEFYSIQETVDNGYIICGRTNSTEIFLPNGESKTFSSKYYKGIIIKLNEKFDIEWIESLEGTSDIEFIDIKETQDGGFVVGGNFRDIITLNNDITLASKGKTDVLIVKYNSDRDIEWTKCIGGTDTDKLEGIIQLKDGSIVITGYYTNSIIFEDGSEFATTGGDTENGYIAKYNLEGTQLGFVNIAHKLSSICATSDGGYLVGGYASSSIPVTDKKGNNYSGIITIKYDSKDTMEWISSIKGYGYINSIIENKDNEYIIGGYSDNNEINLSNGDKIVLTGTSDAIIGKIGNKGNIMWLVGVTGDNTDEFECIAQTNDGGIVAAGYFSSSNINLNNGQIISNSASPNFDGMVLKYIDKGAAALDVQEITVNNYVETFNITTDIIENNNVKGGSISGEDATPYESVRYGNNSNKEIKITPEDGYKVSKVLVNGEEITFMVNEDNSVVLEPFIFVKEDKHIEVSFIKISNEFILEKYSEKDNKPLQGVKFTIEQIEGTELLSEPIEAQTNSEGKIILELPIGIYTITETETLDGYQLLDAPITYEMLGDQTNILKVTNKEYCKVIIHHYLENTTISLSNDEIKYGKANEEYSTLPKTDLEKYELIKDENDSYILPDNASDVFKEGEIIEVTYYYTQKKIPLKINHYIFGTTDRVTLENNEIVEEETKSGIEGQEYTTNPILSNLNPKYELVENPSNANGIYEGREIIVNYYYKIKEFKITTKVSNEGGSISGQNESYYEIVKYNENATREIVAIPEEGYEVKTITVNGAEYNFTENQDRSVTLSNINNVLENKEIIVTFSKISSRVIVHHYIENTTDNVPTIEGEASDEVKNGFVGDTYTTKPVDNVLAQYQVVNIPENSSGIMTEEDIEVTYYYTLKEFNYTVEYYYDEVLDESKTETKIGTYQDVIENYTDKNITGYKLEKTENLPLTISANEAENVIKIYYIIDDGNIKTLSYTVEYYKDNVKVDADTQTVTSTVQILQPDTLTVDKTQINTTDKYTGYKFEKTEVNAEEKAIPETVNNGDVIKVYYVKDEFNYTVEYYYDGIIDNSKTETTKATYQDVIENYTDKNITGYKLEKTENLPLTISANEAENVIKVYYIIDDGNTKTLSYTVEYYKDNIKVDTDTQTVTNTVQILQPDTLTVDKTQINTTDKYTGYKFEKTEVNAKEKAIPETVDNGDVIKIYYIIDDGNTKTLSYTVEYYKDNVKVDADTQTVTSTVQILQPDTLTVDKTQINTIDKYTGYKFEKTELNAEEIAIPETVNNGDVIKVYYVKDDFAYTVEYYYDGIIDENKTENASATYQDIISTYIDKNITGYKLEKTENLPLTISANESENVIKVYYIIDDGNTKTLSYTVEYYKDGVKVDADTQTVDATVQVLQPDTLTVDKTQINTTDKYVGYKLDKIEPTIIPETANNGDVIKVYYVKDEFNYTVEYYYDGIIDESKTENASATYQDIISTYIDKNITGYKLEKTENLPLTISANESENVIKVYYIIDDGNTKTLSYTVEYYKDGVKVDADTQTVDATVQVLQPDTLTVDKKQINTVDKYTGYKFEKTEVNAEEKAIPETVNNGDVIKVYYVKDEFNYTVEYYYDGIIDNSKTETTKATYQDVINTYTEKVITGYKLEKTENLPLTISANEAENVIKVYYIIDDGNTKTLSYTVEYYKDNVKVDTDTQTVTNTVQILQPDTLTVDKTQINTTDKYTGYKFEKTEVNAEEKAIPETVDNGDVIKIYYVKNEFSYTVEYYYDGILDESKTEITKATYQDIINTYTEKVITGYKLEKTENLPLTISANEAENVIKVYYIIDDGNTKTLSYTVEYYKDNVKVDTDTQTVTNTVQILQPDTLTVDKKQINTVDKYTGYRFEKTEINAEEKAIPDTVNNGDVIKVYYEKDTFNYTVEYYYDGILDNSKKETSSATYQDIISTYTDKVITGYKLEKTENLPLTISADETTNVIKVYYVKDEFPYTVEYYYDGILDNSKTEISNATYQDIILTYTDKNITGYKLEKTENLPLTISANEAENVIKVYYIIDDGNTKTLSYTVEYYKDNVKVDADTQTVTSTVQVLQPDTLTVDKTQINTIDKYIGYKLDKIEPTIIPETVNNGDVIKIYYVKNEFSYTVEYYYDGILDNSKTETTKATYQDIINTYTEKVITGYKLEKTENLPLTISANEAENVIKIYYIIDDGNTKTLSYTVEYYKDNVKVDADTQTVTSTVQILQPDTLTVDKTQINTIDKYIGYKFEKTEVNAEEKAIPDTVNNGDVIKVYYVKDEFNYTVEYYYDGVLDSNKTETTKATYQDIINTYTEKVITGYKLEKTENLPLTISEYPVLNVIRVYYVKDKIGYTVNYYYDGVKDDSKTENLLATFGDKIESYKDKIEYGYKFEKVENLPLTVTADVSKNIINVYYVRKDSTCVVKYVYKVSGEEISEEVIKTGKIFDKYDVSEDEKEIPGYTLIERPNPTTGTFTEEEQTKIYYYAKNTQVIVKYLEKDETPEDITDNNVLADEEIINGYEGKSYITEPKEIENYTFVESINNTSGTMTKETITVIYYYLENTKVIVNHIDKNTGKILETVTQEGKVEDEYTSSAKDFEGYVLVEKPEQETVVMAKETITLNYYYVKISAGVVEKHINIRTGEILYNELHEGNEGDTYSKSLKEFEGYDVVTNKMYYTKYVQEHPEYLEKNEVTTMEELLEKKGLNPDDNYIPENQEGIMTLELIEVKYYYIRKASVKVEYIDKITGEKIVEDSVTNGHEGDPYKTKEKTFEGYKIVKEEYPENAEGIMEVTTDEEGKVTTETIVKYYYIHEAKVIERHIDVKTNKLIEAETTYNGYEGELYSTSSKEFTGYDLVEEQLPENSEGTMNIDAIVVNYYYIRKVDVVVEYIDKNTGENLLELVEVEDDTNYTEVGSTEHIYGHEGDSYKTEEKQFKDYVLVETANNTEGTMEITVNPDGTVSTTTYVKYYYAHTSGGVIVQHIDITTGELLEKETTYEGKEGDSYSTSSKTFEGYDLVETKLPLNAEGTMEKEEIKVIYYYKANPTTDENKTNTPTTDNTTTIINNNTQTMVITDNKGNADTTTSTNTNKEYNPTTGDNIPVIALGTIFVVAMLNIIQIKLSKLVPKKGRRAK